MRLFEKRATRTSVDLEWLRERIDNLEEMLYAEKDRTTRLERKIVTLQTQVDGHAKKIYITAEKAPLPDGSSLRNTVS